MYCIAMRNRIFIFKPIDLALKDLHQYNTQCVFLTRKLFFSSPHGYIITLRPFFRYQTMIKLYNAVNDTYTKVICNKVIQIFLN